MVSALQPEDLIGIGIVAVEGQGGLFEAGLMVQGQLWNQNQGGQPDRIH